MKSTAADVLIDTIAEWGVDVMFGMPGDGINGIMEALRKRRTWSVESRRKGAAWHANGANDLSYVTRE